MALTLSDKELAGVLRSLPSGASYDDIKAAVQQAQSGPTLSNLWAAANRPLGGSPDALLPFARHEHGSDEGTFRRTAEDFGATLTAPINLASSALGIGGHMAGARGMLGLAEGADLAGAQRLLGVSKAARTAEAALQLPYVAEGLNNMVDADSPGQALAGAAETGLGTYFGAKALTHPFPAEQLARTFNEPANFLKAGKGAFTNGEPYAIISAENPFGQVLPPEVNGERTKLLLQDLQGKAYTLQQGHYGGNPETSVLVVGIHPEEAAALGRKFGQDAVITHEGWHRLGDNAKFPHQGLSLDQGAEDFYSELPHGTKYQFGFPHEAFNRAQRPLTGLTPERLAQDPSGVRFAQLHQDGPMQAFGSDVPQQSPPELWGPEVPMERRLQEMANGGPLESGPPAPDAASPPPTTPASLRNTALAPYINPTTGKLMLEHRSSVRGLTEIDPAYQASGTGIAGNERYLMQAYPDLHQPASYFNLKGTEVERPLRLRSVYDIEADPDSVYDYGNDTLSLHQKALDMAAMPHMPGTLDGGKFAALLSRLPFEAGFDGMMNSAHEDPYQRGVVTMFKKLPATMRQQAAEGGGATALSLAGPVAAHSGMFEDDPNDPTDNWKTYAKYGIDAASAAGLAGLGMSVGGNFGRDQEAMFRNLQKNLAAAVDRRDGAAVLKLAQKLQTHAVATGQPELANRMQEQFRRAFHVLEHGENPVGLTDVPAQRMEGALKPTTARRAPGALGTTSMALVGPGVAHSGYFDDDPNDPNDNWKGYAKAGLDIAGLAGGAAGLAQAGWFPKGLGRKLDRIEAALVKEQQAAFAAEHGYASFEDVPSKLKAEEFSLKDAPINTAVRNEIRKVATSFDHEQKLLGGREVLDLSGATHGGLNWDERRPFTQVLAKDRKGTSTTSTIPGANGVKLSSWSQKRMDLAYEVGRERAANGENWGDKRWLYHLSNGDPEIAVKFSRLLGAFSPGQETGMNSFNGVEAFTRAAAGEHPDDIMESLVKGHPRPNTARPNFKRAVGLGRIFEDKTEALAGAELGRQDRIPIDMWLLRALGANTDTTPGKSLYRLVSEAVSKAAEEKGENPFAYMAQVWMGIQRIAGRESPSFAEGVANLRLPGHLGDPDNVRSIVGNLREHAKEVSNASKAKSRGAVHGAISPIATNPKMSFAEWQQKATELMAQGDNVDVLGKKNIPKTNRNMTYPQLVADEEKKRANWKPYAEREALKQAAAQQESPLHAAIKRGRRG